MPAKFAHAGKSTPLLYIYIYLYICISIVYACMYHGSRIYSHAMFLLQSIPTIWGSVPRWLVVLRCLLGLVAAMAGRRHMSHERLVVLRCYAGGGAVGWSDAGGGTDVLKAIHCICMFAHVKQVDKYIYIYIYCREFFFYIYIYIYICICFCHTAGPQIFVYL